MKRLFAIIMLTVLLFNSIGYRIVASILANRADSVLDSRIADESFDESTLIEIRIPIDLPYHTTWDKFENYTGEIEVNGQYYKYVKRKVIVDSLILLCLPNHERSRFEHSRARVFELVNSLKGPLESKPNPVFKNLMADYLKQETTHSLSILPVGIKQTYTYSSSFFTSISLEKPVKPPEV